MSRGCRLGLSKTRINDTMCFIPAYESDRQIMNKLPWEIYLNGKILLNRNPKLHDKFMAILRTVVSNTEKWSSVEQLLVALKFELNLIDWVEGFDGEVRPHPRSIAFDEMDDIEFENLVYQPGLEVLAKELNVTVWELETNFGEYL